MGIIHLCPAIKHKVQACAALICLWSMQGREKDAPSFSTSTQFPFQNDSVISILKGKKHCIFLPPFANANNKAGSPISTSEKERQLQG